jgi:hypothetical protein
VLAYTDLADIAAQTRFEYVTLPQDHRNKQIAVIEDENLAKERLGHGCFTRQERRVHRGRAREPIVSC